MNWREIMEKSINDGDYHILRRTGGSMNTSQVLQRIDLPMLRLQRRWLIEKAWEEDTEHIIWGLVHLLDELQDALEVEA